MIPEKKSIHAFLTLLWLFSAVEVILSVGCVPEPPAARGPVTLVYDSPDSCLVQLRIENRYHAPVIAFPAQQQPPGEHQLLWDCRDRFGDPVPAGLYFLRVEACGTERLHLFLAPE